MEVSLPVSSPMVRVCFIFQVPIVQNKHSAKAAYLGPAGPELPPSYIGVACYADLQLFSQTSPLLQSTSFLSPSLSLFLSLSLGLISQPLSILSATETPQALPPRSGYPFAQNTSGSTRHPPWRILCNGLLNYFWFQKPEEEHRPYQVIERIQWDKYVKHPAQSGKYMVLPSFLLDNNWEIKVQNGTIKQAALKRTDNHWKPEFTLRFWCTWPWATLPLPHLSKVPTISLHPVIPLSSGVNSCGHFPVLLPC